MDTKQIIQVIKAVSPSKASLPILENVLLNGKSIIVTDLENTVIIPFSRKGINVCVPARRFIRILETMPGFTIRPQKACKTKFVSGSESVTLTGEDPAEYPNISIRENFVNGKISKIDYETIKRTIPFVSGDQLRPAMMGVLVHTSIVATNGHEMHYEKIKNKLRKPFYIYPKTLKLLEIFKGSSWTVSFVGHKTGTGTALDGADDKLKPFKADHIVFTNKEGIKIINRFNEEKYPNWKTVIPIHEEISGEIPQRIIDKRLPEFRAAAKTKFEHGIIKAVPSDADLVNEIKAQWEERLKEMEKYSVLQITSSEFASTVKRASEYSNQTTQQVTLSVTKKNVIVQAEDLDFGSEYKKTIPHRTFVGNDLTIGFSSYYLERAINTCSEMARIEFFGANRAAIFDGKHLVMPVRLTN